MIIEKIELENFRCHTKKEIELSKGINLILGRNGSGKSSILEAIGLVLLGEDNNRSIIDQIKLGEKSAQIIITFIGNDGIRYKAERIYKISGAKNTTKTISRLYQDGSEYPLSEDKANIEKICAELLGLEKNPNILYKNVVTAYQNKFVDMFSAKAGSNVDIINSIFDTEIYKNIAEKLRNIKRDHYDVQQYSLEKLIESEKVKLIDENELESQIKEYNAVINTGEIEIKALESDAKDRENAISELIELKNKIKQLIIQAENNNNFRESKNKDRIAIIQKIEAAAKAIEIVKINKPGYERYLELSKEIAELDKAINELDKIEKKLQKNLANISKVKQNSIKAETDLDNYNQLLKTDSEEIEAIKEKLATINADSIKYSEELSIRENELKSEQEKKISIEKEISKLKEIELKLHTLQAKLEDKRITKSAEEYNSIIEDLQDAENSLAEKKKEKDRLNSEIKTIKARIKDNDEAAKELATGLCPILKENCKNISAESNAEYFKIKKQELQSEIDKLAIIIETEYSNIEKLITDNQNAAANAKSEKQATERIIAEINLLKQQIELTAKDKTIAELEFEQLLSKLEIETKNEQTKDNLVERITSKITEIKTEIGKVSAIISEQKKNIAELDRKRKSYQINIAKYQSEIKICSQNIEIFKAEIDKLETENNDFANRLENFESIKAERRNKSEEAELLRANSELYTANLKLSETKPELETEKAKIEAEIAEFSEKILELEATLSELKPKYSEQKLAELEIAKAELEIKLKELSNALEHSRIQLALSIQSQEQNAKRQEEIAINEKALSIIHRKIELSEKFRTNLQEMSREIAKRRLQQIELTATENYKVLSGKAERIEWTTEGKTYAVRLISPDGKVRTFEMLSGGEQVSVALSLRSALASLLTRSKFAIFDEPTINLDTERRTALSENLHKMLETMEQSIIVTHDGNFEEMAATKIIMDE